MLYTQAGIDAFRCDRVLREFKGHWQATGSLPDSSGHLLVAMVATYIRILSTQGPQQERTQHHYMLQRHRLACRLRKVNISCYCGLAIGMKSWAADAVKKRAREFRILKLLAIQNDEAIES
jgi:hypothetical protein